MSQGGALLGDAALPGGGAQLGARPHGLAAPAEGAAISSVVSFAMEDLSNT